MGARERRARRRLKIERNGGVTEAQMDGVYGRVMDRIIGPLVRDAIDRGERRRGQR